MSKLQINTRVRRLAYYLDDFEKGRIRIPLFQRDVTWSSNQKLDLFRSILKGYPIGTILFWKPESYDEISNIDFELSLIGSYYLTDDKESEFYYILDGYQRLSTLLNCLIDPNITSLERDNEIWYKEFCIYYDLALNDFKKYGGSDVRNLEVHKVPLYKFSDSINFYDFQEALSNEDIDNETKKLYLQRYKNIGSVFNDYLIPSIDLSGGNLQEAIEIFSKVNTTGTPLKDDWKLSALTINDNFRLGTLINQSLKRIENKNFYQFKKREAFKDKFIFKTIQSSFGPLYLDSLATDVKTLSEKPNFSEVINTTLENCVKTIDFFKDYLLVLDLKFIPANLHFIFLVQYFNIKGDLKKEDIKNLKLWFWQSSYTNCFTKYNPAKRKKAFDHFLGFCKEVNNNPFYWDEEVKLKVDKFPDKIDFGGVRKQSLALFMVNYSIFKENILTSESINNRIFDGVNEYKIFKNENSIGNTVFIPIKKNELNEQISKHSSIQFLLSNEFRGQYEEFFITDEMRDLFAQKRNKELLKIREELIKKEENRFIQFLSLDIED
jgi:hypothetical protein